MKRRPEVEQFVYMSTSRNLTAAESSMLGATRAGVFSGALVTGLRGDGEAKVFNVASKSYDVTTNRLLMYLVNRVREKIAELTLPNSADPSGFLQTPTLSGERFSDPVLTSISRDSIPAVTLKVQVSPSSVCSAATLVVERDDVEVRRIPPPLTTPHEVCLAPKEYSLTACANAFTAQPVSLPLDLYRDSSATFTMYALYSQLRGNYRRPEGLPLQKFNQHRLSPRVRCAFARRVARRSTGGNVPAGNLVLLTSPAANPLPATLAAVQAIAPATSQAINDQLREIPNKFADPADRFCFSFAGHGLTAPSDIAEEAILPADFTLSSPIVVLGVRSILEWLKTSQYNGQFIFVDAFTAPCRLMLDSPI